MGRAGAAPLAGALSMFAAGGARAEGSAFQFDQPAQPLAGALRAYSATADEEIMFADQLVAGRKAPQLKGAYTAEAALMATLPDGVLMQRAARGLAHAVADLLGEVYGARVHLLVGSGANGGDALHAGAHLARRGASVTARIALTTDA